VDKFREAYPDFQLEDELFPEDKCMKGAVVAEEKTRHAPTTP